MDPQSFWQFFGRRGHHGHHGHHGHEAFFGGRGGGHRGGGHRGGGPGAPGGGGNPFGGNPFGGNPFGGGGFPFGGPFAFMRRGGRARRGDVRVAILVLLGEEPCNGYQLMQKIEQRSEGAWRPSPGAMYPALQQLEDEGLVQSESAAGGRMFRLTDKGREQAKEHEKDPAPWDNAAAATGHEAATELRQLFGQVALAAMQVAQAGTPAQVAEARKVLGDARKALYRILAEDAPSASGDDEDGDEE